MSLLDLKFANFSEIRQDEVRNFCLPSIILLRATADLTLWLLHRSALHDNNFPAYPVYVFVPPPIAFQSQVPSKKCAIATSLNAQQNAYKTPKLVQSGLRYKQAHFESNPFFEGEYFSKILKCAPSNSYVPPPMGAMGVTIQDRACILHIAQCKMQHRLNLAKICK